MSLFNFFLASCFCVTIRASESMSGVHLRIAVFNEPPLFTIKRNPSNTSQVRYSGISSDVFDLLSSALNFTFTYVEVPLSAVKLKGTIEEALIDELVQNNADVNGRFLTPSIRRLPYVDFTIAVSVVQFTFIQPMPQIRNRFLAAVKPFQLTVWAMILFTFAFTVLFLTITSLVNRQTSRGRFRVVSDNAWYAFDVLMSQGAYLPSNRNALRLVAGTWCLAAFVLVYAYNSTLISYISLPTYEPVINDWEDMANSKTRRLVISKGNVLSGIILNAETGVMKSLGDSFRKNPNDLILNLPGEVNSILKSGCCAYVEVKAMCQILTYRNMKENGGKCELTMGKDLDFTQFVSMAVAKRFPYLDQLNQGLIRSREAGIFARMSANYVFKSAEKCSTHQAERPKTKGLNLYDLATAFILLGLGYGVSFLVFLLELIGSKFNQLLDHPDPT